MKYQTGDVVLVNNSFTDIFGFAIWLGNLWTAMGNWFKFLLNKEQKALKYTHVGIMVDSENIVEAFPPKAVKRQFPYKKGYAVYRKKNLEPGEMEVLKKTALSYVEEKYSFWLIFCITILKLLRIEWIVKGIGYTGKICSVLVAKCFDKIYYLFQRDQSIDVIDPMDIADCVMVEDKNAWEKVEEVK